MYWVDKFSGLPGVCVSYDRPHLTEGNGDSYNSFVGGADDDEGRYVIFESVASNLAGADAVGQQIIVHDRKWEESWLSQAKECTPPDGPSFLHMITNSGKDILFTSDATNMIDNLEPTCTDGSGVRDLFIRDGGNCEEPGLGKCKSSVLFDDYTLHAGKNTVSLLDGDSANAHMTQDGAYVVFDTEATVPVHFLPDTLGNRDIFLYTDQRFSLISRRAVVSTLDGENVELVNLGGPANGDSANPQVSESGRYIAFDSKATDLVLEPDGDSYSFKSTAGKKQVYLYDRGSTTTVMISVDPDGKAGNGDSQRPFVAADGRYVFFESTATNLVAGITTTAVRNIFVRDVTAGRTYLVTPGTNPSYPAEDTRASRGLNQSASITHVSPDGLLVAYETAASNAINGVVDYAGPDTNGVQDVFLATNTCPTDSDGDNTPDCIDECINDPSKVDAGQCGCGVADTDSDGDGTADCNDQCAGQPEVDSDSDGTMDCMDSCPSDPDKTEAGVCGCEVPDSDGNGNGTADCIDPTGSDTPAAPRVKVLRENGAKVLIRIIARSTYPGANVTYEFNVMRGKKASGRTYSSAEPQKAIRIKRGVKYRLRYRVKAGSTVTQYSPAKAVRK